MRPYAATFAAFFGAARLRADPHRLRLPGMPVRIVGHHSRHVDGLLRHQPPRARGPRHDARPSPDLTVVCAADANQLRAMLRASLDHAGAMYIRLGRGRDPEVYPEVPGTSRSAAAIRLHRGPRPHADHHRLAGAALPGGGRVPGERTASRRGSSTCTRSSRSTRPRSSRGRRRHGAILTVEEHNVTGGLGTAVAEVLARAARAVPFRRHGVPDEHVADRPAGRPLRPLRARCRRHRRARRFLAP